MMARHRITIPDWHPTPLNKMMNCHYFTRASYKKLDCEFISFYSGTMFNSLEHPRIPDATGPRRVRLIITLGPRERACDPDAYWKSTLDALNLCNLLVDDNRQNVELMPVEFVRGPKRGTTIELEDM